MTGRRGKPRARTVLAAGAALIVIVAMVLDTKIVKVGSAADIPSNVFSPASYGKSEFPKVQAGVQNRAIDAATLAAAVIKDPDAAGKQYGIPADAGPEVSVTFTGTAGKQDSGVYDVSVKGVPNSIHLSVQTGPAITGTDLRDATGKIAFGQFSNQIDYQNAGSALNKEMKLQVLSKIGTSNLTGKTISVVGVFELTDPNDWVVTPVKLTVQ